MCQECKISYFVITFLRTKATIMAFVAKGLNCKAKKLCKQCGLLLIRSWAQAINFMQLIKNIIC